MQGLYSRSDMQPQQPPPPAGSGMDYISEKGSWGGVEGSGMKRGVAVGEVVGYMFGSYITMHQAYRHHVASREHGSNCEFNEFTAPR